MRKMIFGTLITFIVVAGALQIERSIRTNRGVPVSSGGGQVMPAELSLKSFPKDERVQLKSFSGKVVLVNFWASWCDACMAEMPSMVKLYDALHDEGFEMISINVDDDPEKVVPTIVSKFHIKFPIYRDTDESVSKAFEIVAIPFNALIDKKSKVIFSESGERNWFSDEIIAEVRKHLKEQ